MLAKRVGAVEISAKRVGVDEMLAKRVGVVKMSAKRVGVDEMLAKRVWESSKCQQNMCRSRRNVSKACVGVVEMSA